MNNIFKLLGKFNVFPLHEDKLKKKNVHETLLINDILLEHL